MQEKFYRNVEARDTQRTLSSSILMIENLQGANHVHVHITPILQNSHGICTLGQCTYRDKLFKCKTEEARIYTNRKTMQD
jgi:hypothetical protein